MLGRSNLEPQAALSGEPFFFCHINRTIYSSYLTIPNLNRALDRKSFTTNDYNLPTIDFNGDHE